MADGRKPNIKTWLRESNLKTFLLFLLFSTIVWVLVQLAEDFEETVSFPITYTNIPKDVLLDNPPKEIRASVELTGFRLIILKVVTPKLTIDVSSLAKNTKQNSYTYSITDNLSTLSSNLNLKNSRPKFLTNTINIPYNQKLIKVLPVIAQTKLSFAAGYSKTSTLKLRPDSIKVSGKVEDLNTIDTLYTEMLLLEDLSESKKGRINIAQDSLPDITLYQSQVAYELDVAKFTEGRFQVPIKITNIPSSISVSIFPKEVEVSYQTTLEKFDSISSNAFKVVKDFRDLDREQSFFIPEVTKQPERAVQVKVLTNKVQYIIKE